MGVCVCVIKYFNINMGYTLANVNECAAAMLPCVKLHRPLIVEFLDWRRVQSKVHACHQRTPVPRVH